MPLNGFTRRHARSSVTRSPSKAKLKAAFAMASTGCHVPALADRLHPLVGPSSSFSKAVPPALHARNRQVCRGRVPSAGMRALFRRPSHAALSLFRARRSSICWRHLLRPPAVRSYARARRASCLRPVQDGSAVRVGMIVGRQERLDLVAGLDQYPAPPLADATATPPGWADDGRRSAPARSSARRAPCALEGVALPISSRSSPVSILPSSPFSALLSVQLLRGTPAIYVSEAVRRRRPVRCSTA